MLDFKKGLVSFVLIFTILSEVMLGHLAFAVEPLDWDPAKRVLIRDDLYKCEAYLSPRDKNEQGELGRPNESVGIPLSASNPEDFRKNLKVLIQEKGFEALSGSYIYITGVLMGREKAVRTEYENILREEGIKQDDVKVKVISVPEKIVKKFSLQAVRALLQQMKSILPGYSGDYQTPMVAEVTAGLVMTAGLELPMVITFSQTHPTVDSILTLTTHFIFLASFTMWSKTMGNWFKRSPTRVHTMVKQVMCSAPFIFNFNVFGKFTPIKNYFIENGFLETLKAGAYELPTFLTTQAITIFLQTVFYSHIINEGFMKWRENQKDKQKNNDARVAYNFFTFIPLAVDSMLMSQMSTGENPWLHIPTIEVGPININQGHWLLVLWTALLSPFYFKPQIFLDPALNVYQETKTRILTPFKRWFEKSTGIKNFDEELKKDLKDEGIDPDKDL